MNEKELYMNQPESTNCFKTQIGRTTYVVGVFFNDKAKASYDDKAKKLMMSDLKAGNF